MIIDRRLNFCVASALSTAGTGRANVGDQIDLGNVGAGTLGALSTGPGDILGGSDAEGIGVVIIVSTAVTSGGAATVSFEVASDDTSTIATNGTATIHAKTADIPRTALVAGYTFKIGLSPAMVPGNVLGFERYLGVQQNVGTAALTAGAIHAFLTRDVGTWVAYPDAVIG